MRFLELFAPSEYQLDLSIDKHTETITGTAQITGESAPDAKEVRLHAENFQITTIQLGDTPVDFTYAADEITIPLPAAAQNPLRLTIQYSTPLRHNMEGAYLSSYQYQGREERLVATQFESHYARCCFPCVDEPAAKAIFRLKITVPDGDDVILANTEPVNTMQPDDGGQCVEFAPTPRMSTYLLAFVVGKLHARSVTSRHGVKVTSYAALSQAPDSLDFANQIAADALDYYDDQFGIPYPLRKLDQVALPDFSAGAMENWGLVTYREACLLADPAAALATKRSIASTICHELSHQWFGDLVTMQWWDDLWLNESFANAMEYFAVDALRPEFDVWRDFYTGDCVYALRRDALEGVQAVQQPVEDATAIDTLFDPAIVYAKGARLMIMLMRLLGQEQFLRGIHDYFERHQYQNTTGDDLWAALQPYADFDVREFMHYWLANPGYPVLTQVDGQWQQHRFTYEESQTEPGHWPLPEITDDLTGHYLINLSEADFQAKLACTAELSREENLRLIIDRTLLAQSPAVPSASLVDLFGRFEQTADPAIWDALATAVNDLKFLCPVGSDGHALLQQFFRQILPPLTEKLNFVTRPDDSQGTIDLRATILALGVFAEYEPTMTAMLDAYQPDLEQIDSELRSTVLAATMKRREAEVFDALAERYPQEVRSDLRDEILYALTLARQPEHQAQLLRWLDQPEVVRPQDHAYLVVRLLDKGDLREPTRQWILTHWEYLEKMVGNQQIDNYLSFLTRVRTEAERDEFWAFARQLEGQPAFGQVLKTADAAMTRRLRLLRDDQEGVWQKLREAMRK